MMRQTFLDSGKKGNVNLPFFRHCNGALIMRSFVVFASLSGAMAVAMGAWAAHGLAADAVAQGWVQKGAHYQLMHALALVLTAILGAKGAARLFSLGLILFPLTLYLLALGAPDWVRTLTPLGGTAMIGGWLALAWWGVKKGDRLPL